MALILDYIQFKEGRSKINIQTEVQTHKKDKRMENTEEQKSEGR